MKWTKRFAVILAAVCCLCGCTKSTIISPEAPSDVELAGEDGIVWGQLWEDFQDKYDDSDAMIPQTWTELTDEESIKKMNRILDLLDDDDDVQAVYHNWDE